ncbi:MAG: hypothetical protein ACYDHX_04710 [Methanothrix sp.]
MGVDDIPTSFGYPTLVRTFLPGFITALIVVYILVPALIVTNVGNSLPFLQKLLALNLVDKFIVIVTIAIISGHIIQLADLYIYQFLEGIRFWPSCLRKYYKTLSLIEYEGILQTIGAKKKSLSYEANKATPNVATYLEIDKDISYQNRRLHRYPFHKADIQATDLGNALSEYENYPFDRYGISFDIYWSRIWEILPDDVKTDIDLRGSKTDFIVYLTFISLVSIPLIAFRSCQLWGWKIAIGTTILSWLLTKIFLYKLAVTAHANYGGYIESVFDIYRFNLAEKLGLPATLCPTEDEKKIWQEYTDFLLDNVEPTSTVFRAAQDEPESVIKILNR